MSTEQLKEETSLLEAIKEADKEKIAELMDRAESGEIVRII